MENGKRGRPTTTRSKIVDFKDLETWKVARNLRREVYKVTRVFPAEEKYNLSSQMRRAASSVTANLAEGYGRFSFQENIQFCRQSRGSVFELRDHLTTALDAGFLSEDKYTEFEALAMQVIRLLNGYIRRTKELQSAKVARG